MMFMPFFLPKEIAALESSVSLGVCGKFSA